MDDDGSKKLDYEEFKKGIHDYGLLMDDCVSYYSLLSIWTLLQLCCACVINEIDHTPQIRLNVMYWLSCNLVL